MIRFSLAILCALLASACSSSKQDTTTSAPSADSVLDLHNRLTETQQREGWKLLFDGTSMNGWRIYKGLPNNSWEVSAGTLHCKPAIQNGENQRADLMTDEQYKDFEFAFDWKLAPRGNSGVMFHVTEQYDQPYASGPEFQLIDDLGYPEQLKPAQLTGANYDMHMPSGKTATPVGDWNTSRIVVKNNNVEHWLNGVKVVTYELHSADWNEKRKQSKWKDFPGYGMSGTGHFVLQDHGAEVWFRNLFVKPL